MQQNPHHQASLVQQNQLRGHQTKLGQVDQMHLHSYTPMQDLVDVYNAQQEVFPQHPPGHVRMSHFAQQLGQMGGPTIKMEELEPRFQNR